MAEDPAPSGNGKDESSSDIDTRKTTSTRNAARPRSPPQVAAVNAIQASRKPRREGNRREEVTPAERESPASPAPSSPPAAAIQRADSDPWTVPQSVRDRFVQDGHRFYFPDGAPAFRDLGRRLTTVSENTQVVRSLIEIAHSRGWTEVTVTGTERFRQEAWRQARLEGLAVRGYRPTDEQQAQLIRTLGRTILQRSSERDVIATDGEIPAAPLRQTFQRGETSASPEPHERIAGKLLEHGRDTYRHDPNEEPSYFVRVQTREGPREVWGKDIERAVAKSLTQPQIGDEVILQRTGRDAVTVTRQERDAQGNLGTKEVNAYRNRWVIEKKEFFEQRASAAEIVRNDSIGPRDAVRQHPELAGTYLNLRAAELASKGLRDPEDRRRFVAQVRAALADGIERGEPLQPVRLRERAASRAVNERALLTRE